MNAFGGPGPVEVLAVPEAAFGAAALALCLTALWLARPRHRLAVLTLAVVVTAAAATGLARIPVGPAGILFLLLAVTSLALEFTLDPGLLLHAVGAGVALAFAGLSLRQPWDGAHPAFVVPICAVVTVVVWRAALARQRCATPQARLDHRSSPRVRRCT